MLAWPAVPELTLALIYHDVVARHERDTAGFPGPVAGVYKLEPDRFSAHLDALAATEVEIGLYGDGSRTMLTFDDGGASALWVAGELERHGWRGVFFVVTGRLGTPGFIDADGVRELRSRGHEVGSHSNTHPAYMARMEPDKLADEWVRSRERLAEILGSPPRGAAVPGGSVSEHVVEQAVRAGYEQIYTSTPRARVRRVGASTVIGRYTIWAADPPQLAAAFARGARLPRARRLVAWELKSAAKRISPRVYEAARAARARR